MFLWLDGSTTIQSLSMACPEAILQKRALRITPGVSAVAGFAEGNATQRVVAGRIGAGGQQLAGVEVAGVGAADDGIAFEEVVHVRPGGTGPRSVNATPRLRETAIPLNETPPVPLRKVSA